MKAAVTLVLVANIILIGQTMCDITSGGSYLHKCDRAMYVQCCCAAVINVATIIALWLLG